MKRVFILFFTCFFLTVLSSAQPVLIRTGTYTYDVPDDQSVNEARITALERAKIKILENEFGTVVGVVNVSTMSTVASDAQSSFLSIGQTDVKGEWLSTVGEPSFELSVMDGQLYVKVKVTGKIREFASSSVEIATAILRNGANSKYKSDTFADGDDVYVYFKSPASGYVAIYQYDSDGVFRLLPYSGSALASIPVKGGKEYVFFVQGTKEGVALYPEVANTTGVKSKYNISCNRPVDICRYYIIFSKNDFSIANDNVSQKKNLPAMIDFEEFNRWMGRSRSRDKDMVVAIQTLTLKQK